MVNILICILIGILMVAAIFYIVRTKINAKKNGSAGSGLVQWEPNRYRFKSSDPELEFNN